MQNLSHDDKLSMFLTAIKANTFCKEQRKNHNLLRATPVGQHIEPQIAKESAIKVIDCFNRIHNLESDRQSRNAALVCLKSGGNCQSLINAYVNFK